MTSDDSPFYRDADEVYDKARRYGLGRVVGAPARIGGEWYYTVRFEGGASKRLPQKHLDPREISDESLEQIVLRGRFGSLEAFQRAIAVARIRKESSNRSTVYSFDAQRVQFHPYQYRPLLRFLDSEDRRLLIADEVGLGKTIEAGIILAELEARQAPDRVLVVCPSRLREKWYEELNRKFAQEFEIWSTESIRDYARRVRQNPSRSRMRAIVSLQGIRNEEARELLLDSAGHFDLLILDEAHHVRNRSTESYRTLEALASVSAAVLFLTATPIHLKSEDLFNQLRLLRPTEFRQPEVFANALRDNEGVVRAMERIRTRQPEQLAPAALDIQRAFAQGLYQAEGLALVREIVERLNRQRPTGLRDWFELERDVERLHYLANILTRTRKREVQAFRAERYSRIAIVRWTPEEHELFRAITGLGGEHAWPTAPCGFGTMQRQRMAASSLVGTRYYRDDSRGLEDLRADQLDDDAEPNDTLEKSPAEVTAARPARDSKFEMLLEILAGVDTDRPGSKVLVFTYFVGTSRYLSEALNARGWTTLRIAGDVPSCPNKPEADERGERVRQFRDDATVRVMVSTEVGSEGLDFQFCSTLVNYDLPWNPMTVEQRIGRIDRFGQKAEKLHIWSLVVEGSIEQRILARLYERIGIFTRSIGPMEIIVGQEVAAIRKEYFDGKLTPDEAEARCKQSFAAIERNQHDTEQLEAEADRLFGHEDFIRAECERVRHLGRYVTPAALLAVVNGYLAKCHPQLGAVDEGGGVWSVRLSESLQQDLLADAQPSRGGISRIRRFTRGDRYHFALEGKVAYDRQDVDLLNASHPFVLKALNALEALLSEPVNRTGVARVRLAHSDDGIPPGTYVVASFRLHVTGIRERSTIETSAASLVGDAVLDAELAERLLHLVLTQGEEAFGLREDRPVPVHRWTAVQRDVIERAQALEAREAKENELLVSRRRTRLHAEHEHRMRAIDARERTARERGNLARMQGLLTDGRDKATARLEEGLHALEKSAYVQASSETDPIAVCLVEVVRG